MPIATGLLAYGLSGKVFHAPFIATHPGFALRAIVERHEKTAAHTYPRIISYDTVDALLADPQIALVIINTPNDTHAPYAIRAMKAGKHVLIEKPAAITGQQVRQLYELGRTVGRHVMVYQNRRYDSDFLAARQVIESGALGNLTEVHMRMDRYRLPLGKKRSKETAAIPGSGLSYDLGPHLLDSAIALFGRPLSFTKTIATHRPGSQVDDYFHFHLCYPGQLQVLLTASLLVAAPGPGITIHGTAGSYYKPRGDVQETQLTAGTLPTDAAYGIEPAGTLATLTTINAEGEKITTHPIAPKGDYNEIFHSVYATITHNAPFPIKEEEIVWQLEMLESEAK